MLQFEHQYCTAIDCLSGQHPKKGTSLSDSSLWRSGLCHIHERDGISSFVKEDRKEVHVSDWRLRYPPFLLRSLENELHRTGIELQVNHFIQSMVLIQVIPLSVEHTIAFAEVPFANLALENESNFDLFSNSIDLDPKPIDHSRFQSQRSISSCAYSFVDSERTLHPFSPVCVSSANRDVSMLVDKRESCLR